MRALDSNVLLRHFMQDDPTQSSVASHFLTHELSERDPGFLSVAVLCEVIWTLRTQYGDAYRDRIVQAVRGLIAAPQIVMAEEVAVAAALGRAGDLADAIIHELGRAAGCSETVTFDRRFAKLEGVRLLGH